MGVNGWKQIQNVSRVYLYDFLNQQSIINLINMYVRSYCSRDLEMGHWSKSTLTPQKKSDKLSHEHRSVCFPDLF